MKDAWWNSGNNDHGAGEATTSEREREQMKWGQRIWVRG